MLAVQGRDQARLLEEAFVIDGSLTPANRAFGPKARSVRPGELGTRRGELLRAIIPAWRAPGRRHAARLAVASAEASDEERRGSGCSAERLDSLEADAVNG